MFPRQIPIEYFSANVRIFWLVLTTKQNNYPKFDTIILFCFPFFVATLVAFLLYAFVAHSGVVFGDGGFMLLLFVSMISV